MQRIPIEVRKEGFTIDKVTTTKIDFFRHYLDYFTLSGVPYHNIWYRFRRTLRVFSCHKQVNLLCKGFLTLTQTSLIFILLFLLTGKSISDSGLLLKIGRVGKQT